MMENIGKMIEHQSLGEPSSESVDSPGDGGGVEGGGDGRGNTRVGGGAHARDGALARTMLSSEHPRVLHQRHQQHHIIARIDAAAGGGGHIVKATGGGVHHVVVQPEPATVEVGCEELAVEEVDDLDDQRHHHNPHHHQTGLSVIVQPQEDSEHESELLSPGKLSPTSAISVSVASMIDAGEFRALQPEPTYQTLQSVNGRMSPPGFSPTSSYATLTPLQPLPPISTMSDKFAYGGHAAGHVPGTFAVMQTNGGIGTLTGLSGYATYDKMGMTPPHNYSSPNDGHTATITGMTITQQQQQQQQQQQPSPLSPQSSYSQNGLPSPQKSMSPSGYDSPYQQQQQTQPQQQSQTQRQQQQHSPGLSPQTTGALHSPGQQTIVSFGTLNGLQHGAIVQAPQSHHQQQQQPPTLVQIAHPQQREQTVVSSPSPPVLTIQHKTGSPPIPNNGNSLAVTADVEEINTKDLAQRISAELKRYSIPQAIFAQRVLCRSQGTLSDLLRNPKPWSKLKSGRETFRRMWKWLQEPEFQRMSALRLAG